MTLEIDGGGTAHLNTADTHMTALLASAGVLGLSGMGFVTADAEKAGSTIVAKAAGQTLTSLAGSDTLIGFSGFGDTFLGTSAGLNLDTISGFGGVEAIDLTDLLPTEEPAYSGSATSGKLTLSDGTHAATITMEGNFSQALFHIGTDHSGGSLITYG